MDRSMLLRWPLLQRHLATARPDQLIAALDFMYGELADIDNSVVAPSAVQIRKAINLTFGLSYAGDALMGRALANAHATASDATRWTYFFASQATNHRAHAIQRARHAGYSGFLDNVVLAPVAWFCKPSAYATFDLRGFETAFARTFKTDLASQVSADPRLLTLCLASQAAELAAVYGMEDVMIASRVILAPRTRAQNEFILESLRAINSHSNDPRLGTLVQTVLSKTLST